MTTYRVGPNGATVFNEKGEALARLRTGWVVVEGTRDTAKSPPKRVRGYADKKVRPEEDK
jgi:hypothetical protein